MIGIHFIINPISGNGKHNLYKKFLKNHFPEPAFEIEVHYSQYKKHAEELTRFAVTQNPDYIIACGGDGTINEVASCLINTKIKLGIIPVGSGNGLAGNLNIPINVDKAIAIIKTGISTIIDVGKVNDHYFFSNMGIGIDALIIKKYEDYKKRTLFSYVKASLASSFTFHPNLTHLKINAQTIDLKPFLLFVSNSNEMGYGMSLTPKARLNDGWLDLMIVPQLNILEKINFGVYVLFNKVTSFKKAQHSLIQKVSIAIPQKTYINIQIDGEYHFLNSNSIEVEIIKNGLQVLVYK